MVRKQPTLIGSKQLASKLVNTTEICLRSDVRAFGRAEFRLDSVQFVLKHVDTLAHFRSQCRQTLSRIIKGKVQLDATVTFYSRRRIPWSVSARQAHETRGPNS